MKEIGGNLSIISRRYFKLDVFMEKKQKKEVKKKVLMWVLIGVLLVGSFVAYKTLVFRKQMDEKRKIADEQRQVMVDYWKSQGLSDEEIEEKMENERETRESEESKESSGIGVVKLFTGGRGAKAK